QFRSLVVADEGPHLRVVHGIGQVPGKHATNTPAGHLPNGERSVQYTHIRVHTHHDEILDSLLPEKTVNFLAVVRDSVKVADVDFRVLTRPGFIPWFLAGVAATVRVVDGQRRLGDLERFWKFHWRRQQKPASLRRVLVKVHRFGWCVDDLDAPGAGGLDDGRHPVCERVAAGGWAL